jgi:DNA-binding transcriptional ArsR family regulator
MLQVADAPLQFGSWRRRMRRQLRQAGIGPLVELAPPAGYSPDFLTPTSFHSEVDEAVNEVMSAPRAVVKHNVSLLVAQQPVGSCVRQLSEARSADLVQLGNLVRRYHQMAIEPYWDQLSGRVRADHQIRVGRLASGGLERLFTELHPAVRWRPPILEVSGFRPSEIWLRGRGLRLQPSYFCWGVPTKLRDSQLAQVLVYPIQDQSLPLEIGTDPAVALRSNDAVTALIGRTRASALQMAVEGSSTTRIAAQCGISPSSASYQTAILRDAGLLRTIRTGKSVTHLTTPLGLALLERNS